MESLIALHRSAESFCPEGNGQFHRNLKQERGVFTILCGKEEHRYVELTIWEF
jgi:hypothetical protein